MTWVELLPLIIKYGIPATEKIWRLVESKAVPTDADWTELKDLVNKDFETYLKEAKQRYLSIGKDDEPVITADVG